MDVVMFTKEVLEAIQKIQPQLDAAAKVMTAATTIGSTVVQLVKQGKQLYTYLVGEKPAPASKDEAVTPAAKDHVAILIDINRRMLADVTAYLQGQGIDANIFIVTNDPAYSSTIRFLDVHDPAEWEGIVKEFSETIGVIKRHVGKAQMHFFLSTPLPIAFGLGSVWGTVDEAVVYHWEGGTYHPTMTISRRLR